MRGIVSVDEILNRNPFQDVRVVSCVRPFRCAIPASVIASHSVRSSDCSCIRPFRCAMPASVIALHLQRLSDSNRFRTSKVHPRIHNNDFRLRHLLSQIVEMLDERHDGHCFGSALSSV